MRPDWYRIRYETARACLVFGPVIMTCTLTHLIRTVGHPDAPWIWIFVSVFTGLAVYSQLSEVALEGLRALRLDRDAELKRRAEARKTND